MYFVYMCENRTMKPVEIVPRREGRKNEGEASVQSQGLWWHKFFKTLVGCRGFSFVVLLAVDQGSSHGQGI
jgi:hypothetical protein